MVFKNITMLPKLKAEIVFSRKAPEIRFALNGLINCFKPVGISVNQVRKTIVANICRDLNMMEVRPPNNYLSIDTTSTGALNVNIKSSFADDVLVVGPRYQVQDMICSSSAPLGRNTSGVLLLGINDGTKLSSAIHLNRPTRAYQLTGRLGEATDNHFSDGKVVEKATFTHVKRHALDAILASMQSSHQKKMFDQCGVDIQSQAAYEIAIKGPIRPVENKLPVLYGIKCVQFSPPDFAIEIQCLNEYEQYLMTLIHEIGMQLHSVAHCRSMRCLRHGYFNIDNAVLRRHWGVQGIIKSIEECRKLISEHPNMLKQQDTFLS